MRRSYRGLGLVVLMLLVVAPLTLFAVLSLFEDESADSIDLSLDGVHWTQGLQGTLLASPEPWEPGESRSAIVYVRNAGPDPVHAEVAVLCRLTDDDVTEDDITVTSQVDEDVPWTSPCTGSRKTCEIEELGSDQVVPLTLTATLADTAPIGATLDGQAVAARARRHRDPHPGVRHPVAAGRDRSAAVARTDPARRRSRGGAAGPGATRAPGRRGATTPGPDQPVPVPTIGR